MPTLEPLQLGAETIGLFLNHRRPLLMIDGTEAYSWREPRPTLKTFKNVSANEPIFAGHFPDLLLWPGIYTLEGLGQSCHLLGILNVLLPLAEAKGVPREDTLKALVALHRSRRFEPVTRLLAVEQVLAELAREKDQTPAVAAAIDVKFLGPVFAGDRIDFTVEFVKKFDALWRFDVRAEVRGKLVLKGTHTGSVALALGGREVAP
jgi:3-hydroxyacyl-[acyl-carrier-protein] dehydratase